MAEIWKADEVEELAKEIVGIYHSEIKDAKIAYLFKEKASKYGGKLVIGKASKCSPTQNTLHGFDFTITIGKDIWDTLNDRQKRAVVDHELYHCGKGKHDNWSIIPHDCEEFIEVIKRYGDDAIAVKSLLKTIEEMRVKVVEERNKE